MQVNWRVAETLRRHGQTPAALARASGLNKTTVYNIVNNRSKAVELETLYKLVEGLEKLTGDSVSFDEVFEKPKPLDDWRSQVFKQARRLSKEELRSLIPDWTPEEQAHNERVLKEIEKEKQEELRLQEERQRELEALFAYEIEGHQ